MELIDIIFKSKGIEPTSTVTVHQAEERKVGHYTTTEKFGISRNDTLHGLPVSITIDKLWYGTKLIAEEYTLISHKTARNLTAQNFLDLINQHI